MAQHRFLSIESRDRATVALKMQPGAGPRQVLPNVRPWNARRRLHRINRAPMRVARRIRRRKLRAVPMSPKIQRVTMAARQIGDHLVPTARVEASGMAEHHGWIGARPFPHRDVHTIDGNTPLDRHPLQSSVVMQWSSGVVAQTIAVCRLRCCVVPARQTTKSDGLPHQLYAKIYCADANSGRNTSPICLLSFSRKSPHPHRWQAHAAARL